MITVCWSELGTNPDAWGYREHRVLNWLEINDTDWEEPVLEIAGSWPYKLAYVGVDSRAWAHRVVERLAHARAPRRSSRCGLRPEEPEERQHLIQLLQRRWRHPPRPQQGPAVGVRTSASRCRTPRR